MPHLVLSPRETDDSRLLASAAQQLDGWTVIRLKGWRAPDHLLGARDICLYGESLFTIALADELKLALLEAPYDWLVKVPDPFINRDLHFMRLAEGRQIAEARFFKPAAEKPFKAGVMTGSDLPGSDELPDTFPILVSEIVTWTTEFRCFVLDGRVVSASLYERDGEGTQTDSGEWPVDPDVLQEAQNFAQSVVDAALMFSPPAYVVDVGQIDGRGWAVLEANPASASGIYGCDPAACLPVIARACVPADELSDVDRRWVQNRPTWDAS